jgi:hypothetical protein
VGEVEAIAEFVKERLGEREAAAKAATPGEWYSFCSGHGDDWYVSSRGYGQVSTGLHSDPDGDEILMIERDRRDAEFIAANDPAAVLRDVTQTRLLVAEIAAFRHDEACCQPLTGCGHPDHHPCDCGRDQRVLRMLGIIAGRWDGHSE